MHTESMSDINIARILRLQGMGCDIIRRACIFASKVPGWQQGIYRSLWKSAIPTSLLLIVEDRCRPSSCILLKCTTSK